MDQSSWGGRNDDLKNIQFIHINNKLFLLANNLTECFVGCQWGQLIIKAKLNLSTADRKMVGRVPSFDKQ